jgi:TonB family protein
MLLFAAFLLLAAPDTLEPAQPVPETQSALQNPVKPVTHPIWTSRPSVDDLVALYPRSAKGVEGRVGINCLIDTEGKLISCEVAKEDPLGLGFDQASLRLTKLFRMKKQDGEGAPVVGRRIYIPVFWLREYAR